MRVLVGYASKHGGTREIAERIAARLKPSGLEVELCSMAERADAAGFDAYVLGSSIYMGHWNKEAVAFAQRNRATLSGRPVWLFSSGPVGNQEKVDPIELNALKSILEIREHRLFGGAVKLDQMSFAERLLAKAMKVSGDDREWAAIEAWADHIRNELSAAPAASQAWEVLSDEQSGQTDTGWAVFITRGSRRRRRPRGSDCIPCRVHPRPVSRSGGGDSSDTRL